jgi:hypothetical protein
MGRKKNTSLAADTNRGAQDFFVSAIYGAIPLLAR